ncbi:hypothetical protein Tco_0189696 [Tanacetum coccineum]
MDHLFMVLEVDGVTRTKTYEELTDVEKLQDDCDFKATNIILQGLPPEVYSLVNHHYVAKEIWDRVKLLMQGTELSLQEHECKLYDDFDRFTSVKGDDPIVILNKAMAFLTTAITSRFPTTNNQPRTSSNPRNQATIQDGRVTVQQVHGRHEAKELCMFKEKILLVQAHEAGQVLDEEQLAFLVDPGVAESKDTQTTIIHNAVFQTDDLDAFDSECDD